MIKSLLIVGALGAASAAQACEMPKLELGYLAAASADMATTLDISKHPGLYETNPILGAHPSNRKVLAYFAATDLAHAGITCLMVNADVSRRTVTVWEAAGIGFELALVGHNYTLGLKMRF
jgi:hypothetical protein